MRCARYTFLLNKGEKHWTWVNIVPKGALANGLDDGKVLIGWRQMLILCAVSALSVVHAILNLFVSVFVTSRGTKKRFSQQTTMSSLCTASQHHIVPCDGHTGVEQYLLVWSAQCHWLGRGHRRNDSSCRRLNDLVICPVTYPSNNLESWVK